MLRGIMTASVSLDLPPRYLDKVRAILQQYVPDYNVWAYGSRVRGGAFEASDLDLVVRNPRHPLQPCDLSRNTGTCWNLNLPLSCADSPALPFPLRSMHRPSILPIARNHQGKSLI